jgi:diguanylate cyclase (GGDEF)-like protein/PAS domain S-box-containing protein
VPEDSLINLLIVDRSPAAIEQVVQTLRVAGYRVDESHTDREEDIRSAINYRPLDLIIARPDDDLPTLADIARLIKAADKDIPLIALVDASAATRPAELLRAGADNFCIPQDVEHLAMMVRKELQHLRLRQQASAQELRLKESELRSRLLMDSSRDAIAYIHEGVHTYANPTYTKLFGYSSRDDLVGVLLMDLVTVADHDKLKRFLRQSFKAGGRGGLAPLKLTVQNQQGQCFPVEMECVPTRMNDEPCLQILIQDPFERQALTRQIETAITRDAETGLYNRKYLNDYLDHRCTGGAPPGSGAVLYILLTDYRAICEQGGLEASDELTAAIARLLREQATEPIILARFADAVFTLYTPESNRSVLLTLAEQLGAAIKNHSVYATNKLFGTATAIGVCLLEGHDSASQLLMHADRACEAARQQGANQVQVYSPPRPTLTENPSNVVRQEEQVMGLMREAISKERLYLYFQPIVSFQDNTTERYKAYLRILDADQNVLPLETLAPVAESRGLMGLLDRWAVAKCLEVLSERYEAGGKPTTLFIRISRNSVQQDDFCDWLDRRLSEAGLPGSVLVLEVTEAGAEQYFKQAQRLRTRLQQLGCGFALSHFGGKPGSENVLKQLRPNYIKLDSVLIQQLAKAKDDDSRHTIATIAELAQQLSIVVVATDIASAPQMAGIWQFGVSLVQGDMLQEASPQLDFDFQQFVG